MDLMNRYAVTIEYEEICESWDDVTGFFDVMSNRDWWFRGQADATWWPRTSFERFVEENNRTQAPEVAGEPQRVEDSLWNYFTPIFDAEYITTLKEPPHNTIERYGVIQHYGVPTRLLDWSCSPYVAAFFAYEEGQRGPDGGERSPAIWALNAKELNRLAWRTMHHIGIPTYSEQAAGWSIPTEIATALHTQQHPIVVPLLLPALDVRMQRQQAAFTFYCAHCYQAKLHEPTLEAYQRGMSGRAQQNPRLYYGFMEVLSAMCIESHQPPLRKLVLPTGRERWLALDDLDRVQKINRVQLFPGIDGLAEAAKRRTLLDCNYLHQCDMICTGRYDMYLTP